MISFLKENIEWAIGTTYGVSQTIISAILNVNIPLSDLIIRTFVVTAVAFIAKRILQFIDETMNPHRKKK